MLPNVTPSPRQLYERLKQDIEGGTYQAGDRLPSERELSGIYGVGRQAIRQALRLLKQDGLIITRRGSGSYLRPASGWSTNGMAALGLVVSDVSAVAGGLVMGVVREARKRGYAVVLDAHQDSPEELHRALQRMIGHKVATTMLILPRDYGSLNVEILEAAGTPYLLLMRDDPELQCDKVVIDNAAVGEMAAQALIAYGCRNLVFLGPLDYGTAWNRLRGMRQALRAAGITYQSENVLDTCRGSLPPHLQAGGCLEQMIQEGRPFDGICAFNDTHAAAAVRVLQAHGIAIPEDVAVIGMDDRDLALMGTVPLTTIRFDTSQAGARAVDMALHRLTHPGGNPRSLSIGAEVVWRDSCPPTGTPSAVVSASTKHQDSR